MSLKLQIWRSIRTINCSISTGFIIPTYLNNAIKQIVLDGYLKLNLNSRKYDNPVFFLKREVRKYDISLFFKK